MRCKRGTAGKQEDILGSVGMPLHLAPTLLTVPLRGTKACTSVSCPRVKPESLVTSNKEGNRRKRSKEIRETRKEVGAGRKPYLPDVLGEMSPIDLFQLFEMVMEHLGGGALL